MSKNPYYSGPRSDHFDGTRFFVPGVVEPPRGLLDVLRWRFSSKRATWAPDVDPAAPDLPPDRVNGDGLRVAYIGHASTLVQTAGLNLLIDPVFSERASPLSFAGPCRANPPGVALERLPRLDAILVTHSHYDHLDLAALATLAKSNPCRVITPLGNDTIMRRHDPAIRVEAYDWGDKVALAPDVSVTLTPANHWSARGISDRRMALWASFLIDTPGGAIYAIGDTGYDNGAIFREMRLHHPAIRFAILPIGAYEPRWFMRGQHVDPEESVAIFLDCGAAYAMAHHWGTCQLTDEDRLEPPKRLAIACERAGLAADRFVVRRPGETFDVPLLA
jgi:L-ascorbate metabolism protein UlaG (beta-lactamase superfamily)